ncbi:hypothetical protein C8J56DRAFT_894327 [Mycena floridula]|nr:hypothetical protein C8J56DRAFT_894327 [Mycena floridula]
MGHGGGLELVMGDRASDLDVATFGIDYHGGNSTDLSCFARRRVPVSSLKRTRALLLCCLSRMATSQKDQADTPGEEEHRQDQGFYVLSDGQRVTAYSLPNLYKKQRLDKEEILRLMELYDELSGWNPALLDEGDWQHKTFAMQDVESSKPEDTSKAGEDKQKRQRYETSSWNGRFWEKSTLFDEGLTYQLGHGGFACPCPKETLQTMTVMGEATIQSIRVRWCQCERSDQEDPVEVLLRNRWYPATIGNPQTVATFDALEMFRVLNVAGNLNVCDYVTLLEILTDGSQSGNVQRAGRGHDPGGIGVTKPGGAAVLCWACPHEGINLPENWRDVDPSLRFIYMLFVNAHSDPPLGAGLGYQVPKNEYKKHLKGYVSEEDSQSIGGRRMRLHASQDDATIGFGRSSKGERYANMDFILFSAILGCTLLAIFLTYDIACQYRINLESRNKLLPQKLQHDFEKMEIHAVLPIWHGDVHFLKCQTQNLVQYQDGAGKTDGEVPERLWGEINEITYATREMGEGTREDVLEDRLDFHNIQKNVKLGATLEKKLRLSLVEEDLQKKQFDQINSTIGDALLQEWSEMYENWYLDRKNNASPFAPTVKDSMTKAEVQLQLKQDKVEEARVSKTIVTSTSLTGFLTLGLELEETHMRFESRVKICDFDITRGKAGGVAPSLLYLTEGLSKAAGNVYGCRCSGAGGGEEERRDSDDVAPQAEDIKLWLPSQLQSEEVCVTGCRKGLVEMEIRLREAQCTDPLTQIRGQLHAKRYLINYRNTHVMGQRGGMKA